MKEDNLLSSPLLRCCCCPKGQVNSLSCFRYRVCLRVGRETGLGGKIKDHPVHVPVPRRAQLCPWNSLRDSLSLWPCDEDLVVLPGNLFQCFTAEQIILENKVQSWKASKCEWKHVKINTVLYKEKIGVRWHRKEIAGRFNAWSRRSYSSRNFILFLNSFTSL